MIRWKKLAYFAMVAVILCLISSFLTLKLSAGPKGQVTMPAEEFLEYMDYAAIGGLAEAISREYYIDPPDKAELMAGAARGMVDTLGDPYARYYTAGEYEEYLSDINGEYFGLGMKLAKPDGHGSEVMEVYPASPAAEAGIRAGDVITHVSGDPVAGMELDQLQAVISAGLEDGMSLSLFRGDEGMEVNLSGAGVFAKSVQHSLFNQRTGYISISMFTGNCAEEFHMALDDLTQRGMRSLVIDLRDNPGGSLDQVIEVADELLGQGMRIVSVGRAGSREETVCEAEGKAIDVPLAVLVNENSASASEILAAAIQENNLGAVVGNRTYGKGIVQTTMYVEEMGGWLKLTTDSYYTPKGNDINGKGITPDISSDLPEECRGMPVRNIDREMDTQLWAGLDYVRSKAG